MKISGTIKGCEKINIFRILALRTLLLNEETLFLP